jgi:hypothetical protein
MTFDEGFDPPEDNPELISQMQYRDQLITVIETDQSDALQVVKNPGSSGYTIVIPRSQLQALAQKELVPAFVHVTLLSAMMLINNDLETNSDSDNI